MIPEFFVKMKQIPLNVNGKPDVSKLPVVMKAGHYNGDSDPAGHDPGPECIDAMANGSLA